MLEGNRNPRVVMSRFSALLPALLLAASCSGDPEVENNGAGFDLGNETSGDVSVGSDTSMSDVGTTDPDEDMGSDSGPADFGPDTPPPVRREDCVNGVDDNADGAVDCEDAECAAAPVCIAEVCDNGVDDDDDGTTDCRDLECATTTGCLVEICNNGKSDDDDGDIDCADDDCADDPACSMTPEICDNDLDDDGDGLANCRDEDCAADMACTNIGQAGTCTTDGQSCNTMQGIQQNGFYCVRPMGVQSGPGICYEPCNPADQSTCAWGTLCFDPAPQDADPRGVCIATACTRSFTQAECAANEQCEPFVNGYSFCRALGTGAAGDACDEATPCGSGLVCSANECRPSCDLANPSCGAGEECIGAFAGYGWGVCDVPCTELSSGECGGGEACTASLRGYWACRADGTGVVGDGCTDNTDCAEGNWCTDGICEALCAEWASSRCDVAQTCFEFGGDIGICADTCTSLLPDDCADAAKRCVPASETESVCWRHGGGELGDSCANDENACGQELYCSEGGTCEALCLPYDAASDACSDTQACAPFNSAIGACADLTESGRAQGDACVAEGQLCDDAIFCGPGFVGSQCYQACRTDLTADDGSNPDCANPTDVCDTRFGYADIGFCTGG